MAGKAREARLRTANWRPGSIFLHHSRRVASDEPKDPPSKPGKVRDSSDMFNVEPAKRQLAPIADVPLTKEEVARRKRIRMAVIAIVSVIALIAIVAVIRVQQLAAISSAVATAESSGRLADIDAALALLDGEDSATDVAVRARLHATAVLAGDATHRAEAEALLARHDAGGDGASDHRIAATYLELANGDPEAAAAEAGRLVAGRGPRAAEAAHARALAAMAIGNLDAARDAAESAHDELAGSPRHAALVLEVASRLGESAPPAGAEDATALRIARARVHLENSTELGTAQSEASAVLSAPDATPVERAWAELVTGLVHIEQGDTLAANEALTRAAATPPPGDELFQIELAEGWLALGRIAEADQALAAMHTSVSTDAPRRDLLLARHALVRGDVGEAERSLGLVPARPRRDLVEAQIAVARGEWDRAETLLARAMTVPATELSARIELSSMRVTASRTNALEPIESLLSANPTSPRLAAAGARAYAAAGDRARALSVLEAALAPHPREPLLLLEKSRVHARAAEWEPALTALNAAAESSPRDPVIQLERGLAARSLNRLDEAREALRTSLELAPGQARALVALLGAELDAGALDDARGTEEALAALELTSPDVDTLRARYFVAALAGARGVAAVRAASRRSPDDVQLRMALAQLYLQAERWDDAADALYGVAQRSETDRALALGLRAVAVARARRAPTVEAVMDQLRTMSAQARLPGEVEALMSVAQGWLEWIEEAFGRAGIFARQALDRDPGNAHANVLLAVLAATGRRDPSEPARAAADRSLEARGILSLQGEPDVERCAFARQYLEGAPEGRLASDVRARIAACPALPSAP